jgi:hypothetical protein
LEDVTKILPDCPVVEFVAGDRRYRECYRVERRHGCVGRVDVPKPPIVVQDSSPLAVVRDVGVPPWLRRGRFVNERGGQELTAVGVGSEAGVVGGPVPSVIGRLVPPLAGLASGVVRSVAAIAADDEHETDEAAERRLPSTRGRERWRGHARIGGLPA